MFWESPVLQDGALLFVQTHLMPLQFFVPAGLLSKVI